MPISVRRFLPSKSPTKVGTLTPLPEQLLFVFRLRLNDANLIDCVLKHSRLDMSQRGDLARSLVCRFLNHMPGMTLRPLPLNFMARAGFIQTLPPIVIGFAAKSSSHCLDHVF